MKTAGALFGTMIVFVWVSQGQDTATQPAFDAASLKVADAALLLVGPRMRGGPGTDDPGRITYTRVSLIELLQKAWDIPAGEVFRIVGPSWLAGSSRTYYNLAATIPPNTSKEGFHLMLRNLLIERFNIKLHHETRPFPGYEMVLASGGSKLKESANPDAPDPMKGPTGEHDANGFLVLPPGHGSGVVMAGNGVYMKFQNYTMAELVAGPYLASFIGPATGDEAFHLVDKTGLTGKYDFTLKFDNRADSMSVVVGPGVTVSTQEGEALPASDPSGLPKLFKAIEQQLGLQLVRAKAVPTDVIVIDHLERTPTEN